MEETDYQSDIEVMRVVKEHLEAVENPREEYKNIMKMVKEYLQTFCKHDIVSDDIEISFERLKTIYYCNKCMHTFNN